MVTEILVAIRENNQHFEWVHAEHDGRRFPSHIQLSQFAGGGFRETLPPVD